MKLNTLVECKDLDIGVYKYNSCYRKTILVIAVMTSNYCNNILKNA